MGFPRALKAHAANQLDDAEIEYRRAYDQGQVNEIFFQNFSALLRKQGKIDESKKFCEEGIRRYPLHTGILRNYANLLRFEQPCYAIELYLKAIRVGLGVEAEEELLAKNLDDLINLLHGQELDSWALSLIKSEFLHRPPSVLMLVNLLLIMDASDVGSGVKQVVIDCVHDYLQKAPLLDAVTIECSLATHYLTQIDHRRALSYFESAFNRIEDSSFIPQADKDKLQEMIDANSWNFSCACLALQDLKRGWKLFEHGLRTPAEGHQRWQRALVKPFNADDLPLWRGEYDPSQRLLLLEEQAVGDAMMFITLVPRLVDEVRHLGIYLSPRLESIYLRSFADEIDKNHLSIYTKNDLFSGRLAANQFDRQIPLGSICQHRFVDVEHYAPRTPVLISDERQSDQFRKEYLAVNQTPKRLIGVSWRGGGRGKRIQQKSLEVEVFAELMLKHPDIRFIDLQYGNTSDQINVWKKQGIDIVHDARVNALKNMDLWLSQVKACDAVISVANTTIHGAGGLNLPTQCLLSTYSDWRWFVDPSIRRSYWYPSVGIARQSRTHRPSWEHAFQQVSDWILNGCPMPTGDRE